MFLLHASGIKDMVLGHKPLPISTGKLSENTQDKTGLCIRKNASIPKFVFFFYLLF